MEPADLIATGDLRAVLGVLLDLGPDAAALAHTEVTEADDGTVTLRAQIRPTTAEADA